MDYQKETDAGIVIDAESAPEGNPAQLIRETLALEREIVTGLEKLLKEIEE